jgi:hypothetical protein
MDSVASAGVGPGRSLVAAVKGATLSFSLATDLQSE